MNEPFTNRRNKLKYCRLMKTQDYIDLTTSLVICFGAALFGSLLTAPALPNWYAGLQKPFFNPPNWIFAPVWTTLYFMMGIAFFLVIRERLNQNSRPATRLFISQLGLNVVWSFAFFYLHFPLLAFAVIILLWLAILMTIIEFYKISRPAAWLLIPYLLWVSFAAILNFAVWKINS